MIFVERHKIKETTEILALCKCSKELYNKCQFYMRQAYFAKKKLPDLNKLVELTKDLDCYKNLHNSKTAKQTIRKVLTDWANFKKAMIAYNQDPSKFKRKPKPPKYKKKLAQVIFYNETIRKKPLKQGIIQPTNDIFSIKTKVTNFKQVIITPKTFGFIVDISYEKTIEQVKPDKNKISCNDLGVNNLTTITSDQHTPVLINGRIVKAINQLYNKLKTKKALEKRYFRLENYFHHVSKLIIKYCLDHGIGTIIIGKNDGWKQHSPCGQNFLYIPYENLIDKIAYKAMMYGIEVILTEEAYTSKASFLDRDPLPKYCEKVPTFSGKRVKRGLYITKDGRLINSDVNGSANVGRKVVLNKDTLLRLDRSLAARPVRVDPTKSFHNGAGQLAKLETF